ncbi:fumarylacetoacetase [Nocardia asteroides]|uniref:fumarylacetoacetase n=1 Tax=Nocardia asteroides NBRC 15531 TaxID=1110697 RepID=U5EE84_NOCAS|nr:fumarylacetoacetase [Nocardia asteroides]GAD83519.1 putative fumarylacetoacetase [Nocardia asteroides NBRC 15531]SFL76220.1 fumarylacetoacetate hydrolase [Nocardia asteroides]VEG31261.1 2-keto-4-pentenoate hydratase/2-oxohepta-3-ene-1,7-dioic acid hydratase (catechol pathway) [Nocardia asteroides]
MTGRLLRVEVAPDSLFGPENMPYGIFAPPGGDFRAGVRLGDTVLDLVALLGDPIFARPDLNAFLAAGPDRWRTVRARLRDLADTELPIDAVHPLNAVRVALPIRVGDYVDFYASIDHATNLGRLFRPDSEPLLPNWRHLPVGYHGRAGTVVVSGTPVIRPLGQRRTDSGAPDFGPSRRLDIEAELGFVVGSGSMLGVPVGVDDFAEHVFGVALVNDWSARDIQAWEYQPLGPFLGKSFGTSLSAWITPLAALTEARVPLPVQEPPPLPYLRGTAEHGYDIDLRVAWNGAVVAHPPYAHMYWSPAQMLAHLTANGASIRPGDLYASGTISGPAPDQRGSFIELSWGGTEPISIGDDSRTFLADGDEVTITATAPGPAGRRIGLGEVSGRILPARVP